ncbi:MAG: ABC transporter permease, partial [Bacteroidales bacterium]|nr:ABC transporter permease [Bacteroidales bacterium]
SGKVKEVFGRKKQLSNVTSLKLRDIKILSEIEGVKYISAFQEQSLSVKYQTNTTISLIQGVDVVYPQIRNYSQKSGRIFTGKENQQANKVAVLGVDVANKLFKNDFPIGKTIFINNIPFTVIGVLNKKGLGSELGNIDNVVMIPIKTALRRVFNLDYINKIYMGLNDLESMNLVESEVTDILRNNHKLNQTDKENDFTIISQINTIKASEETSKSFNILIIGVALIALITGGIGILAVMILSVKERINEIGLRKSIGAKNSNIVVQFLSEAMMLGLSGGIIGIIIGIGVAITLNATSDWDTVVSWPAVLISFSFSIFTALLFGVFPAKRAARLNPIEALRTE